MTNSVSSNILYVMLILAILCWMIFKSFKLCNPEKSLTNPISFNQSILIISMTALLSRSILVFWEKYCYSSGKSSSIPNDIPYSSDIKGFVLQTLFLTSGFASNILEICCIDLFFKIGYLMNCLSNYSSL